jgi:hypothetical protein
MLTGFYRFLEQDIEDFTCETTGSDSIYFSQFLKKVIEADNKDKVRQLMIFPVTLAVAISYRSPGRIPEELGTVSEVEGESSGSNVSERFERPTYSQIFYYPLPVYANPGTLSEREAAASADFRVFAELFQRYLTRIDEIINHSSESGTKELGLIDNVLNEIVKPIRHNLMGPIEISIEPGRAVPRGDQLGRPIAIKLNTAFLGISQFVCNLLLVDLDPDTITETKRNHEKSSF